MKITFLTYLAAQNGGNRVISIYAQKLLDAGHDVHIVSRRPQQQSPLRKLISRLQGRRQIPKDHTLFFDALGPRHILLPWRVPVKPSDLPDADILIATHWRTAFEASAMPASKGKKVYFVQHHEVHGHVQWDISRGTYFLPMKKITIADWLVDTMARDYGDTDVVKVENSVDTELFTAPPRARNATPVVGLYYTSKPFKGTDISLKAIEIARKSIPDLKVLAFSGKIPSKDLPLPDGTAFHRLPAQADIPGLYASCDAWLFGSRSEGFGLPLLESMACRTPVVATHAGAAPDLIDDGKNGYIVPVDDAEAMAARLVALLQASPEAWRAMSDAAYDRVKDQNWDLAAQAFEAALQDINASDP